MKDKEVKRSDNDLQGLAWREGIAAKLVYFWQLQEPKVRTHIDNVAYFHIKYITRISSFGVSPRGPRY